MLVEATPVDAATNRFVFGLARAVAALDLPGITAATPAINSLLVQFDPLLLPAETLEQALQRLLAGLQPAPAVPQRVVPIPVVFGGTAGPDLAEVAEQLGLAPAAVVAELMAHVYRVLMIGFSPGYPYIGPLPDRLSLPRRATPRDAVPAGSVAIAAGMAGIYPSRLPGGWHLIGRTPLPLFDPAADPPATLLAGDGVRFTALAVGVKP